jgi:hypothetical protein
MSKSLAGRSEQRLSKETYYSVKRDLLSVKRDLLHMSKSLAGRSEQRPTIFGRSYLFDMSRSLFVKKRPAQVKRDLLMSKERLDQDKSVGGGLGAELMSKENYKCQKRPNFTRRAWTRTQKCGRRAWC